MTGMTGTPCCTVPAFHLPKSNPNFIMLDMAPEVIGLKDYDCKADIFSCGIMLFEILFGNNPLLDLKGISTLKEWSIENVISFSANVVMCAILNGTRPTIPPGQSLGQNVENAWHVNPDERPTARDMLSLFLKELHPEAQKEEKEKKKGKDEEREKERNEEEQQIETLAELTGLLSSPLVSVRANPGTDNVADGRIKSHSAENKHERCEAVEGGEGGGETI